MRNSEVKDTHQIFIFIQTFFQQNSGKKTEEVLPNHKINKWKLVMKLHWDIINKDFNEKVDIVEEDLEEILPKSEFLYVGMEIGFLFNSFAIFILRFSRENIYA